MSPIMDAHALDFISHSVDQTRRLGARLGQMLKGGEVLCLTGELGTGKTCMVQGLGQGLGVTERITSPTFTLTNEYRGGRLCLYHVDLYRIVDAKAALMFGLDDYLYGDGVCAIEWAERVEDIWPNDYLHVRLRHIDDTKRGITLHGFGSYYLGMVEQFRRSAFGV